MLLNHPVIWNIKKNVIFLLGIAHALSVSQYLGFCFYSPLSHSPVHVATSARKNTQPHISCLYSHTALSLYQWNTKHQYYVLAHTLLFLHHRLCLPISVFDCALLLGIDVGYPTCVTFLYVITQWVSAGPNVFFYDFLWIFTTMISNNIK